MAGEPDEKEPLKFYETLIHFPPIINGRINMIQFLEAAQDLVRIVERLGKIFTPVKYDMQGNIDKIKKYSEFDKNSCLLEVTIDEKARGTPLISSVVWLNRAVMFFELIYQELILLLKSNEINVSNKNIFNEAYEGSVKKYHNWVSQQIFTVVCRMGPSVPQLLKAIEADTDLKGFETALTTMNIKLHIVRCKIEDHIKENYLFEENSP